MAQLEVELLTLDDAVLSVRLAPDNSAGVDALRQRFDILYSRIDTVANQSANGAPKPPDVASAISQIRVSVSGLVPFFEGDNASLIGHLPEVSARLEALAPIARRLALIRVSEHARATDAMREAFSMALARAAVAVIALIGALAVLLAVLYREKRIAAGRALEIERIGERLARTVEASYDAIIVTDERGIILDFNTAAERTFGYSRFAAIGERVEDLIAPPPRRDEYERELKAFLESGRRSGRIEIEAVKASGEVVPIETSIGVSRSAAGLLIIYLARDISARLRAEAELRSARDEALAAARAKSQFLAVMSHEMRTPLNGVLAVLDILASTLLDERQQRFLRRAVLAGESLQRQIDDVLDITHLDAANVKFDRSPFDLIELLREIVATSSAVATSRGDRLELRTTLPSLSVNEDRRRLGQVIGNLVGNAIKFTKDGIISITAERIAPANEDESVQISIIDSGVGIAEGDLGRIFEDFVTVDAPRESAARGYGLGLAICRRIVKAMGGEIGVESQHGQGSRFWFRFPLREADLAAPALATAAVGADRRVDVNRLEVLLVEDNETNLLVAREMLQNAGCLVDEAHNGQEGVEAAEAKSYDLILMDINMPILDGIQATRRIRASRTGRSSETPIVGLTAFALPDQQKLMRDAGMQDCRFKPLRAKALNGFLLAFAERRTTAKRGTNDMDVSPKGKAAANPETERLDLEILLEMYELLGYEAFISRLSVFR